MKSIVFIVFLLPLQDAHSTDTFSTLTSSENLWIWWRLLWLPCTIKCNWFCSSHFFITTNSILFFSYLSHLVLSTVHIILSSRGIILLSNKDYHYYHLLVQLRCSFFSLACFPWLGIVHFHEFLVCWLS